MNKKRLILTAVLLYAAVIIWNYPLTYRMGINGGQFVKTIPLYAKACGFLYRDWAYKDIVRNITGPGRMDDREKAVAILGWTSENVKAGIPAGLKSVDDHPLNIIIRQYGAGDQIEDVFTILCSYAGMRAGMTKCFNKGRTSLMIFSLVNINGRWIIFHAGRKKYFLNKNGALASVQDYLNGDIVLSDEDRAAYGPFLDGLKNAELLSLTRADEQMPFRRIPAEIRKSLGRKRDRPAD
jgi:hypothetical protein